MNGTRPSYLSVGESMERNGDGNGSHQLDLTGIIELYLTSCRIEGKSEETIRSYRESLGIFTNVIGQKRLPEDPASFTAAHVYQFLGCVADTGVSAMTQWRRQRETKAFFSWLLRHDYVATNPFSKVKNIKVPQKVIRPFSQGGCPSPPRLVRSLDPQRGQRPGPHPRPAGHRPQGQRVM